MTVPDAAGDTALAAVRRCKMASTQRLLGDTITISAADWTQPTILPGWTRAHLATHLARNADALRQAVQRVVAGEPFQLDPDDDLRELEAGSRRSPLDLQIDLDTTAGQLTETFSALSQEQWRLPAGDRLTIADLPLARLNEVVLHHIDLDCGFSFVDLDPRLARWLLAWNVRRRSDLAAGPRITIQSSSGYQAVVGAYGGSVPVSGSDANLLGWITGRLSPSAVSGADGLDVGPAR
ncbi:MAG: maleylpyruvate isomerase family mycothiol-dependent enzyme [Actinomycetia bacterium]|nr:maleylpyruvate isomerase family mycothiol-dependent enzyme [Actinomycetes bacterium]